MDPTANYYEELEVERFAAPDKVRAAYRQLARKYHPDTNPDPAAVVRFKKISEAHAILSDPDKRAKYDMILKMAKRQGPSTASRAPGAGKNAGATNAKTRQAASAYTHAGSAEEDSTQSWKSKAPSRAKTSGNVKTPDAEMLDAAGAGFKEMFDALFRKDERPKEASSPDVRAKTASTSRATSTQPPIRGQDITVEAMLSREEGQQGVVKTINVQHTEACQRCSATGRLNGVVCPGCNGEKQLITLKKIDVRVPPGVKSGSKVRVAKEGGKGIAGGEPGDLFLSIKFEEDSRFRMDGLNVLLDLPITVTEAALGADIEVPTLTGKVKMTVPPQTSSGKVFRLKSQGVSSGGKTGDQLVTVHIVMPKTLTPREKELYEELARLNRENPRG